MTARPAESDKVRRWNGTTAHDDELNQFRAWVVWGIGAPAERAAQPDDEEPPGEEGTDIAVRIAATEDEEWAGTPENARWVMVVEGDEADVDEWVTEHDDARGYASYLMEAGSAAADTELMEGRLRGDVVRRRRFDAGRTDD